MDSRRNFGREKNGATKILQYLGPKQKSDFGQLYAHNPTLVFKPAIQTQMTQTITWTWITRCILGQKLITFSSKAHDYFRQQRYNYYKTHANRNVHRFLPI